VTAGLRLRLEVERARCKRVETELSAALGENSELVTELNECLVAATAQQGEELLSSLYILVKSSSGSNLLTLITLTGYWVEKCGAPTRLRHLFFVPSYSRAAMKALCSML
jgi:hypothetical protein